MATSKLQRLNPVMPVEPNAVKIHPPTMPPMMPRTISRNRPSPVLFTIKLAIQPAIPPSTTQLMMPMTALQRFSTVSSARTSPLALLTAGCQFRLAAEEIAIVVAREPDRDRFVGPAERAARLAVDRELEGTRVADAQHRLPLSVERVPFVLLHHLAHHAGAVDRGREPARADRSNLDVHRATVGRRGCGCGRG